MLDQIKNVRLILTFLNNKDFVHLWPEGRPGDADNGGRGGNRTLNP
jgi:hypothetical protein